MKEYLGDSVYCESDNYGGVILTLDNGLGSHTKIVMEDYVLKNFEYFIKAIKANNAKD